MQEGDFFLSVKFCPFFSNNSKSLLNYYPNLPNQLVTHSSNPTPELPRNGTPDMTSTFNRILMDFLFLV